MANVATDFSVARVGCIDADTTTNPTVRASRARYSYRITTTLIGHCAVKFALAREHTALLIQPRPAPVRPVQVTVTHSHLLL